MSQPSCRLCRGASGTTVLDLGDQPACDHFPQADDRGSDPTYPLQMWLCSDCGLAQLVDDPTDAQEPRGVEPAALIAQSEDAVRRTTSAGWLQPGTTIAEYGSPHGGSWLTLITDQGLTLAGENQQAEDHLRVMRGKPHQVDRGVDRGEQQHAGIDAGECADAAF